MNYSATCHTRECLNEGRPIQVTADEPVERLAVICGPCGNNITDIKETP